MKKTTLLYEGKAKKVYKTPDEDKYIIAYKDDATAFNGEKKDNIIGKGVVNNKFASKMFELLEREGIKTHFIKQLNDREMLVKDVNILLVEVIVRNVAAGSFSKRYGVKEGTTFKHPTIEFSYKSDEHGDPLMNEYHIDVMNLATKEQIKTMKDYAFKVNDILSKYLDDRNINLIDFKLEFGLHKGEVILADEISPDTCRFWDKETNQKLDKDVFRRNLGSLMDVYNEVLGRID